MSRAPMPVATDPLGAIRVQLVGAARRRTALRRRRRRLAMALTTAAVTLGVVAAVMAVTAAIASAAVGPTVHGSLGTAASADLSKPHGEGVGGAREGRGG